MSLCSGAISLGFSACCLAVAFDLSCQLRLGIRHGQEHARPLPERFTVAGSPGRPAARQVGNAPGDRRSARQGRSASSCQASSARRRRNCHRAKESSCEGSAGQRVRQLGDYRKLREIADLRVVREAQVEGRGGMHTAVGPRHRKFLRGSRAPWLYPESESAGIALPQSSASASCLAATAQDQVQASGAVRPIRAPRAAISLAAAASGASILRGSSSCRLRSNSGCSR